MKRIIFLGAKQIGYECFKFLADNAKKFDYEVAGLLTNTKSKRYGSGYDLTEIALLYSIAVLENLDSLLLCDYDVLISVQHPELLKLAHIQSAKEIAVNLHMAPLPEYRG